MTQDDAFLQAIVDAPDDDTPRLIYADWLEERGDPRGEFIRVQCQLAKLDEADPKQWALESRALFLRGKHDRKWVGALTAVRDSDQFEFERGFVERVRLDAEDFLEYAELLFEHAPLLQGLTLGGTYSAKMFKRLVASPHFANLVELDLDWYGIGNAGARALAAVPFSRLRRLILSRNDIRDAGLRALAASPNLKSLTILDLTWSKVTARSLVGLGSSPSLANLKHLDLDFVDIGTRGAEALALSPAFSQLTELSLHGGLIGDAGAQALARSPYLTRLQRLTLSSCHLGDAAVEALAMSPGMANLQQLIFRGGNHIGPAGATALASSPHLARLEELDLAFNQIDSTAPSPWRRRNS
jgi:uncharacterized protein (TIGR02996 family)